MRGVSGHSLLCPRPILTNGQLVPRHAVRDIEPILGLARAYALRGTVFEGVGSDRKQHQAAATGVSNVGWRLRSGSASKIGSFEQKGGLEFCGPFATRIALGPVILGRQTSDMLVPMLVTFAGNTSNERCAQAAACVGPLRCPYQWCPTRRLDPRLPRALIARTPLRVAPVHPIHRLAHGKLS